MSRAREPGLSSALIPVLALAAFLIGTHLSYGEDWSPHFALIGATAVAALVGILHGFGWGEVEEGMVAGIGAGLGAILVLCIVGVMVATWIAAGIVPLLIHYGLQVLHPDYFLVASCLLCSVVSLSTGSSWVTVATVGVALVGIAEGLGISLPMTAGAIVSGAYFGDKLSPLSETTNLASGVVGADLFEHIGHLLWTTIPAIVLALLLYAGLGLTGLGRATGEGGGTPEAVSAIMAVLEEHFVLSPVLLLAPLLVLVLIWRRCPALPALFGAALLGALLAVWIQGATSKQLLGAAMWGYRLDPGSDRTEAAEDPGEVPDEGGNDGMPGDLPESSGDRAKAAEDLGNLLGKGGIDGMMYTVSLILCSLSFGGVMERCGLLRTLLAALLRLGRSPPSLIASTVGTCVCTNAAVSDQYLAIILPGRMYRDAYIRNGLHPKNLSRTLEDAGTLTSPLVPWNSCGAYMSGSLGVATFSYLPWCLFNLLSPFLAIALASLGVGMARIAKRD